MDLEAIFKEHYPEYVRGNVCLSPFFDLFEAGAGIMQQKYVKEKEGDKKGHEWLEQEWAEELELEDELWSRLEDNE